MKDFLSEVVGKIQKLNLPADCKLLCEPGRALSVYGESLVMQIHLRKGDKIYLNDGMTGNLIEVKLGTQLPIRMVQSRDFAKETQEFTAYGPTCCSLDVYPEPLVLPVDVQEGDWIEMGNVGAYGSSCTTNFNGFGKSFYVEVESEFDSD